jgi:hypothetical protein
MTRKSSSLALGSLLALAVSATVLTAWAWTEKGPFSATIHGHEFKGAEVQGADDCSVSVKIKFVAPPDKYHHGKSSLNYYRFRARVRLAEGKQILSKVFGNGAPGTRQYEFSYDTGPEGCWGKQPHKILNVDVEGCNARGCRVKAFE